MKKILLFLVLVLLIGTSAFSSPALPVDNTESTGQISETTVLKYCKWYVSTPPTDDPIATEARKQAAALILAYATSTTKFSINLIGPLTELFDMENPDSDTGLFMVYLAGETIYCLEHDLKQSDAASFVSAMEDVMKMYGRQSTHSSKALNKYLDMDKAQRSAAFEKLYEESLS